MGHPVACRGGLPVRVAVGLGFFLLSRMPYVLSQQVFLLLVLLFLGKMNCSISSQLRFKKEKEDGKGC